MFRTASISLITMNVATTSAGTGMETIIQSYPELTAEEREMLVNIRKKKLELLHEISQLKDELTEVNTEIEAMDTEEGAKLKNQQMGKKKFNMDPKKGIEFLVANGLIMETTEDVAAFLYKGEGLNKTMIGDYLGERSDFNEAVLKAFVELHDFTDLIVVQALRQFLWSFRLPGEAQKIDRMMESFAQRYCQLNPDIFTNSDTCYVLSFAVIMLNTSLHNPSVKDKPSVDQFVSMNRGINDGGDLPRELLLSLYDSIKTEPFKIPEDDGNDLMHTFFNPDREGWLWKQGGRYKSWKRRWFILNDNCLYYFEFTTDKEPRGIIPLENIQVREVTTEKNKPHCFELYSAANEVIKACKTDSEGKVVEGKHTVYRMSASTEEEKEEWIKCIQMINMAKKERSGSRIEVTFNLLQKKEGKRAVKNYRHGHLNPLLSSSRLIKSIDNSSCSSINHCHEKQSAATAIECSSSSQPSQSKISPQAPKQNYRRTQSNSIFELCSCLSTSSLNSTSNSSSS